MSDPNILVIDDEPGIREGCKRALSPQGFHVDSSENGEEGLNKVHTNCYDIVLIDVMMPGISGIDLITSIHEHDPEIVCIVITGYATVELAVRAIKQGAYDFLTKPFTSDDLLLAVNQGLERRKFSLETKRLQMIETEAHRLAEEKSRLEELDKAKVAFIRLVTHELQAPIAAIQNYLQLILEGYIPPEGEKEYLQRAEERAREQLALIADLLEFGRLREIKVPGRLSPVQVDTILRQVIKQCESQIKIKKIKLEMDVAPRIPPILGVKDQIKSLWSNLITNAIKYSLPGGTIQVALFQNKSNIIGRISDSGIGIPEEAKSKLFTEFFRAENAKSLNITGTGLGLAIVKQIVEGIGGKINVESTVGRGTTFEFSLPITLQS